MCRSAPAAATAKATTCGQVVLFHDRKCCRGRHHTRLVYCRDSVQYNAARACDGRSCRAHSPDSAHIALPISGLSHGWAIVVRQSTVIRFWSGRGVLPQINCIPDSQFSLQPSLSRHVMLPLQPRVQQYARLIGLSSLPVASRIVTLHGICACLGRVSGEFYFRFGCRASLKPVTACRWPGGCVSQVGDGWCCPHTGLRSPTFVQRLKSWKHMSDR